MTSTEIKKELEGCEILSLHLEGCVIVRKGRIIQEGIDITSRANWRELWREYLKGEGIDEMIRTEEEILRDWKGGA